MKNLQEDPDGIFFSKFHYELYELPKCKCNMGCRSIDVCAYLQTSPPLRMVSKIDAKS